MRVLVLSDGIGSLDAVSAAQETKAGWISAAKDQVDLVPVSSGGPGFLRAIEANFAGQHVLCTVRDPLGREIPATIFITGEAQHKTAYIEAAQICGLDLVPQALRDPRKTTTLGMADALIAAAEAGVSRIVVGLGGTATNDGGAGMIAGLAAGPVEKLASGPLGLMGVEAADLDFDTPRARFAGIDLVAACSTQAPLAGFTGASGAYSQNKGADRPMAQELERALTSFANVCARVEDADPPASPGLLLNPGEPQQGVDVGQLRLLPGSGSGGGLGFGLGLLGARLLPGSDVLSSALDLRRRATKSDLIFVVTDGIDATTLGDGPLEIAVSAGVPNALATVALARRLDAGNRELATSGISSAYELFDTVSGVEKDDEPLVLRQRVSRIARSWSR